MLEPPPWPYPWPPELWPPEPCDLPTIAAIVAPSKPLDPCELPPWLEECPPPYECPPPLLPTIAAKSPGESELELEPLLPPLLHPPLLLPPPMLLHPPLLPPWPPLLRPTMQTNQLKINQLGFFKLAKVVHAIFSLWAWVSFYCFFAVTSQKLETFR